MTAATFSIEVIILLTLFISAFVLFILVSLLSVSFGCSPALTKMPEL